MIRHKVVVAFATATVGAVSLLGCGTSYPHAWCGPVIQAVTTKSSASEEIAAVQKHAGESSLVDRLGADLSFEQAATQAATQGDIASSISGTAVAIRAMNAVAADVDKIAAACKTTIPHDSVYVPTS